ncbi:hypothetical protein BSU04_06705 [Caballeronia sordidicola]|uniref:Uncharacterized protein n=1 Tax=Caballeronia sordidicola TaxID=196367 RepID=A0A226X7Q9_CABSO|nr:hypothetical protein BSU04_06705 [Caballeronia sordidicola]
MPESSIPFFYADNCGIVRGDARTLLVKTIEAVRGLTIPAVE